MRWPNLKRIFSLPRTWRRDPAQERTVYVPLMQAGVRVDHETAMTYAAVYAAVRVISETIATLPWRVLRLKPDGSRERLPTSPVERVLNVRPNPEMSPFAFRETMIAWALTWGNGYAEIVRDGAGRVTELWPIAPDRVDVRRDEAGALVYEVRNNRGEKTYLPASSVYHLHGLGYDGVTGYSVISLAARNIGLGLASEEFAGSFFANGAVLSAVLEHPEHLGDVSYKNLKKSLEEKTGPKNQHKPMILEEGMKWKQMGIPPEDAQLLATRQFSVIDIARWFRVPPHKLGDLERATFSNIEHQDREFVVNTLMPWTIRMEQEADYKLFPNRGSSAYTKLMVNALMRGDSQARAEFYQKMANMGVFSINEVRQLEDMDPIGPDGDKRLVQINQTTLEKIGNDDPEDSEPQIAPAQDQRGAHLRLVQDVLARVIKKEMHRAETAVDRYDDRESMSSWIDSFLGGSTPKMIRDYLMPACSAFASTIGAPEQACISALNSYVDQHLHDARASIWSLYEGDGWPDARDSAGAEYIISRISDYAMLGEEPRTLQ